MPEPRALLHLAGRTVISSARRWQLLVRQKRDTDYPCRSPL